MKGLAARFTQTASPLGCWNIHLTFEVASSRNLEGRSPFIDGAGGKVLRQQVTADDRQDLCRQVGGIQPQGGLFGGVAQCLLGGGKQLSGTQIPGVRVKRGRPQDKTCICKGGFLFLR